jgi:hypothetical protein
MNPLMQRVYELAMTDRLWSARGQVWAFIKAVMNEIYAPLLSPNLRRILGELDASEVTDHQKMIELRTRFNDDLVEEKRRHPEQAQFFDEAGIVFGFLSVPLTPTNIEDNLQDFLADLLEGDVDRNHLARVFDRFFSAQALEGAN